MTKDADVAAKRDTVFLIVPDLDSRSDSLLDVNRHFETIDPLCTSLVVSGTRLGKCKGKYEILRRLDSHTSIRFKIGEQPE